MYKRLFQATAFLAVLCGGHVTAQAAEYNLRFAHFWPEKAGIAAHGFQAWADSIEEASDGRIAIDFYPSQTLLKAPNSYDGVRNRIADVAAMVPGYTANRFPLTQVVELPGIVRTAEQGSCIVHNLYREGLISQEFENTHPLILFTQGGGYLHTKEQPVRTPEDMKGLAIRRPSTVVASMIEMAGGQPVAMPAPESYPALQRGVIDGVGFPWEAVASFRLEEHLTAHTELPLYSAVFAVVMNKDVYKSMPADLQKVLDEHSTVEWARKLGQVFDADGARAREEAVDRGDTIITVEGGVDNPAWKPLLDRTTESYLSGVKEDGHQPQPVYERAQELSTACAE